MRTHARLVAVALTVLALLVCPLFAQANYGSLSGVVKDQSGATVPGADVTVTNQGTNASQALITTDTGAFRANQLIPALYEVRVAMMGFQTYVARDVKVNVGGEHSLNVTLEVGELTSIVTVATGVDLVNTSDASVSTTVQTRQIQDLPLSARLRPEPGRPAGGDRPQRQRTDIDCRPQADLHEHDAGRDQHPGQLHP